MSSPQFLRAHQQARNAVATFLPSLRPNPPAPEPPPPHPLAKRDLMQEMTHAASLARHVETASARIAQGLPASAEPPSPEQTFGNVLDIIHTRALSSAIASHPEEQRSQLISEAQTSAAKWIASHNGKVVVHGKVMIAHGMPEAERLAAKIVNDTVEEHDQRKQAEAKAAAGVPAAGNEDESGKQAGRPDSPGTGRVPDRPGNGRSADHATGPGGDGQGNPETVPQTVQPAVGGIDPESGRVVTHSTDDLDQAQEIATAAAPELEDKLNQVADQIPGVRVHGVRPVKDKDRAERKEEADEKPIHTHSDLLAGRLVVDSPEAKDAAVAAIKSTSPVIDEEDSFEHGDPDYGFRSHDLQVALGNGQTSAEVQIVPKEVADVDEETHPTYEAGRDAEADGDTKSADEAKASNREAHDEAMARFNERNGVESEPEDRAAKLRKILAEAGFEVTGDPVRLGGHSFLPIRDNVESNS